VHGNCVVVDDALGDAKGSGTGQNGRSLEVANLPAHSSMLSVTVLNVLLKLLLKIPFGPRKAIKKAKTEAFIRRNSIAEVPLFRPFLFLNNLALFIYIYAYPFN